MVAQSPAPEPGAHYKNALTIYNNILLTITIFAKINSELKYKIFLRATVPNIKNLSEKIQFIDWHPATPHRSNENEIVPKWLRI